MNQEVKYWYLRNHQIFDQMNDIQYGKLCVISKFKHGKKGEKIFFTQQEDHRIYFLKSGLLTIVKVFENGDEQTTDMIRKGDVFGEILLQGQYSGETEYARVVSDEVMICSFRLDDFEQVLTDYPQISLKYAKKIGEKLRHFEFRYTDLVFKDVKSRLLDFVRKLATQEGIKTNQGYEVKNYLTHQDMASLVGASRQTVSTLLKELEHEGKIVYNRSKILIIQTA